MTTRPTFRLEKLRIANFRAIESLTLDFPTTEPEGGLVVLAGDNGCGKTSVLDAIALTLGRRELLRDDHAPLEEQVRFGASDLEVELRVQLGASAGERTLRRRSQEGALKDTMQDFALDELAPRVEYYSSRREPEGLGLPPDSAISPEVSKEARRIHDLKRKLRNAFYHRGGSSADSPFKRLQTYVSRFLGDEWKLDVLPKSNRIGDDDDVIVRRGDLPADITSIAMARGVAPTRGDVPTIVPIDRLSSGQLALFAFAGPLVFRDAPADVVLIDEPEQHLHPKWQRFILGALRELSPESQFFVATHSVDVLDSAMSYERHLLLRKDDPRVPAWEALHRNGAA